LKNQYSTQLTDLSTGVGKSVGNLSINKKYRQI